jgi:hypothetical protein
MKSSSVGTRTVAASSRTFLVQLFALLILIKATLYILDPSPMFYMGDSGAYIATALGTYMPPDRSFVYGMVIRYTAVVSHSLSSLIMFQVVASVVSIICMAMILDRYFNGNRWLVMIIAVIACFEPLQFMMEHYVMTESLAVSIFAIYVFILISYISRPHAFKLVIMQAVGIALVAFRIAFLPIVCFFTALAPILAGYRHRKDPTFRTRRFAFDLILSLVLFVSLHEGYRRVVGNLFQQPPAYLYTDGLFSLALLAPALKASDFPDPEMGERITRGLNLKDLDMRMTHMWIKDQLIDRLQLAVNNYYQANRIANLTVRNILIRDPLAPFRLGFMTWKQFYDIRHLQDEALADRSQRALPQDFLELLKQHFFLYAEHLPTLKTLSNVIWLNATYWYVFLISLPLVMLLCIPFQFARDSRLLSLWILACGLVAAATIFATLVSVRYLAPLGWLGLLSIAIVAQHVVLFLRQSIEHPSVVSTSND